MRAALPAAGPKERSEREAMRGLNARLAGFIEKVHLLERNNHLLETEIREIRGEAGAAPRLEEKYGPELRRLRQAVQEISHQKHQIEVEHQDLEAELLDLRRRREREARGRSDAESNIAALKKEIGVAYRARLELDKKAQSLADEIDFLKRNHEAEASEMREQIRGPRAAAAARDSGGPGVTAALRDIRTQLEGYAVTDVQEAGETFRARFARLTEAAEAERDSLKETQREIQGLRRRLRAKDVELDCAKGAAEALERQLRDFEDRHEEEIIHYQNTIKELENELISCKFDMSGYLREYQDLLNVKMALDVEILSYRKLLCGEEARLSSVSDSSVSLPYIYHQSPVYTLPCLSRPGGPHRRAEPQYKFVEEIITETTREIEMSEFEETGSEETEVGKEEPEESRGDGRGSEEEEEERDNKDSGEEESGQMFDSQQSRAESVNGCDCLEDGGRQGEKRKEPEAGEAEGERGVERNAQSEVLLSESLGEQLGKGAESTEEEGDDDLSPKPEVNVEAEPATDNEAAREVRAKMPGDLTSVKEAEAAKGEEEEEEEAKSTGDARHHSDKSRGEDCPLSPKVTSRPGVSDGKPDGGDGAEKEREMPKVTGEESKKQPGGR